MPVRSQSTRSIGTLLLERRDAGSPPSRAMLVAATPPLDRLVRLSRGRVRPPHTAG